MSTEEAFEKWYADNSNICVIGGWRKALKLAFIGGSIHGLDLAKQASREVFFSEQIEMSGKDHRAEDLS